MRLADRSIFDSGLAGTITGYLADEIREAYSVRRGGAFLEVGRPIVGLLKGALRYQYEIVEPNAPPDILSEIERQDQRIFINSIGASAAVDARDDPIVPSKGYFAALEGKWAFPAASADAHFLKGFAQYRLYRPIGGGIARRRVPRRAHEVARPVRAAVEPRLPPEPRHADRGAVLRGRPDDAPLLSPRRSRHRGPDVEGRSGIGGNALLIANVEWRVPVSGGLGLVLFADWGNVWAGPSYVKLAEGRWGAGLGFHYLTPVGPFRLEYGFRLDRKPSKMPEPSASASATRSESAACVGAEPAYNSPPPARAGLSKRGRSSVG